MAQTFLADQMEAGNQQCGTFLWEGREQKPVIT